MAQLDDSIVAAREAVDAASRAIRNKAVSLEDESKRMRAYHQTLTVFTILFGVSAPAIVTYNAPSGWALWWKLLAVVVTAIASASATIRSVLRFNERYSNSALKSIALLGVESQVDAKREDVIATVKDEFKPQKLFELSAWARQQMLEVVRAYVESEVAASTQVNIALIEAPKTDASQKIDPTRKPQPVGA